MTTNNKYELIVSSTGRVSKKLSSQDYCVWEKSNADLIYPKIESNFVDCRSGGQLGFEDYDNLENLETLANWESNLPLFNVLANKLPDDQGFTGTVLSSISVAALGYSTDSGEFPLHLWVTYKMVNHPSWYIPMLSLVTNCYPCMPVGVASFLIPLGRQALAQQITSGEYDKLVSFTLKHLDLDEHLHWSFPFYVWLNRFKDLNL